ncbi:MAG: hypothetical protein P0Y56_10315 [Candidatus Andeanibacterium colombiense]|uniref:Uncharacterized protein n=1 Tax=Candidatus Andeanibacterium colombiense TaxID=3121345 RepID=A0AAJ6BLV1_9SPHN|nr:MAG: hypothetical protein P0Y56_10315 [Sphingomonadaceae bacterium]
METLRGNFADRDDLIGADEAHDPAEDDAGGDTLPDAIGQDERRMQVRAYNHWASLLDDKNFPGIEDLDPEDLVDFGPYSVLLDFTGGIENPGVSYLGDRLAEECGAEGDITQLSDVPARSLLSRITDHYMQILANQAPIGFEAEFVNQRGQTILYRGILLPYSSDDDTIDFIYGVINWKELADQRTTDELMLEIDQALDEEPEIVPLRDDEPITDWADGPANDSYSAEETVRALHDVVNFAAAGTLPRDESALPMPYFGGVSGAGFSLVPDSAYPGYDDETPAEDDYAAEFDPLDAGAVGLGDWLASARNSALLAQSNEDRSRAALYDAISRAYDFSLAAAAAPEEFALLLEASNIATQERAPMTPVVKLVFGADYDKTRLTEYAAALSHAHRLEMGAGELAAFLTGAEGGLKGVVAAERRFRREEAGRPASPAPETPRERVARQLRRIAPMGFEEIAHEGSEFALVMIRRLPGGEVAMLGEVADDAALVERAAKKLVA